MLMHLKNPTTNLGSWFSVCNLIITQLEEDNLNIFENGRLPQFF
jgi:hypothetical protein